MINSLYNCFKHWSKLGSVYIISDTHFGDEDCNLMDPNWPSPERQIEILKKYIHRNDTLIHLGDVGDPKYIDELKCYKVLILGNHDQSVEKFRQHFDEVYSGPLVIGERLILSHEPLAINPINGKMTMFNIHGHVHQDQTPLKSYWLNVASDVCNYTPVSLGALIKNGLLSNVVDIHRQTIDAQKRAK